jgi:hypothetical protein
MNHPKNKAERRRLNKKYKTKQEHEELVQSRLAQELQETKEALRQLQVLDNQQETSY